MNCKICIYTKCLMRTDKKSEVCPVEMDKRRYIEEDKKKAEDKK